MPRILFVTGRLAEFALRQTLDDPPLHARLRRAVRRVACRRPALSMVKVRLSR